jgi:hypothetical protein
MKKLLLMMVFTIMLTTFGCTKDKAGADSFTTPSAKVPAALQGNWMYGNFSITEYWNQYPGDYLGNAFQVGIAFRFFENGTYEQYFTSSSVLSGITTYHQSVTKGTVVVDTISQTITVYPGKAHYKRTKNRQTEEDRDLAKSELSGATTYDYTTGAESNGTSAIYLTLQGTNSPLTFLKK